MLVLRPNYYENFKCIASECPESCCINWNIDVDKLSFRKYREVKGEFGRQLKDKVVRCKQNTSDKKYARIELDEHKRCSFLDENNLCKIYINLGEKYLCNTCKLYPRYIYKYGDCYEVNVTISCPEVARLVLAHTEPIEFIMTEETEPPAYVKEMQYDKVKYSIWWDMRSFLIEIAQNRQIATWKRAVFIKQMADKIVSMVNTGVYSEQHLQVLNTYAFAEESAKLLEDMQANREVRRQFIKGILMYRVKIGILNVNFKAKVEQYLNFIDNIDALETPVGDLEKEFNDYMIENEYILENYMVYYLYNNIMPTLWTGEIEREINLLVVNYIVLKYLLFIEWVKGEKELDKQTSINTIYSFSRGLEHSEVYKEQVYKILQDVGIAEMASLATLLVE